VQAGNSTLDNETGSEGTVREQFARAVRRRRNARRPTVRGLRSRRDTAEVRIAAVMQNDLDTKHLMADNGNATGRPALIPGQRRRRAMDWNRVEGNWKEVKGKVKEKWAKLTDDDLAAINGQREQLEGRLQKRYGNAKDQAKKDVDTWFSTLP
jgi:uncharacterized protein YjbJ (UPF0337 family)